MASLSGGWRMSTSKPPCNPITLSTRSQRRNYKRKQRIRNMFRIGAPPAAPFNSTTFLMGLRQHVRETEAEDKFNQYGTNADQFPSRWPFGLIVAKLSSCAGVPLNSSSTARGVGLSAAGTTDDGHHQQQQHSVKRDIDHPMKKKAAGTRVLYDPAVHVGVSYYHDLYENDADG